VLPSGVEIVFEDESLDRHQQTRRFVDHCDRERKDAHGVCPAYRLRQGTRAQGRRPVFIVHRLDRETSGLLVFARTEEVKFAFQRGWKSVTKKYHAVIQGTLAPPQGTLRSELIESDSLRVHSTRPARRRQARDHHYRTIPLWERSLTGGTDARHGAQKSDSGPARGAGASHPRDEKYGATFRPGAAPGRSTRRIGLRHPISGEALHLSAPLPESCAGYWEKGNPSRKIQKREIRTEAERTGAHRRDGAREGAGGTRAEGDRLSRRGTNPRAATAGRGPTARRQSAGSGPYGGAAEGPRRGYQ